MSVSVRVNKVEKEKRKEREMEVPSLPRKRWKEGAFAGSESEHH